MEFYSMWKLAVQNVVWKHFRDSKCLSNLLWPFPMVLTRDITEKGERVPSVSLEEPAELEWQLVALVQTWLNLSQHKLMAVPETEPFSSGWAPRQSNGTNTTVLPKRMTKGRQNYFDYTELDWESQFSVILGQTVTALNPDHLTAHWTT